MRVKFIFVKKRGTEVLDEIKFLNLIHMINNKYELFEFDPLQKVQMFAFLGHCYLSQVDT